MHITIIFQEKYIETLHLKTGSITFVQACYDCNIHVQISSVSRQGCQRNKLGILNYTGTYPWLQGLRQDFLNSYWGMQRCLDPR